MSELEESKNELIENLKIALIYGDRNVDGVNRDGEIERIYKDEQDIPHFYYMRYFLQTHFLDEKVIQDVISKSDVNSIFFELQKIGHIAFAENTSVSEHKTGLFYMPEKITDKQRQSLEKFRQQLENEDYTVTVFSELYREEDGILMGKQRIAKAKDLKYLTSIEEQERDSI